jgi:MFS family permease
LALFKSLTHRSFAYLWGGQSISRLGDSLYRIALAWWVLEETGSATAMGTVLVFSSVPMLLFLLIGGVVVDRFPRLRVILMADLLSGTVVAVIAGLAWVGSLEVWHVYIASTIFGFVRAFFFPAYAATVPEVTPLEALPSANSLTSLSQQLTGIVGPALGAALVAFGGAATAFALDALSFFVSAACLLPILRSQPSASLRESIQPTIASDPLPAARSTGRLAMDDLRAGLKAVLAAPWLWITIAIFGFVNVTSASPRAIALPFLVKDNLHAEVKTLGLFYSMTSLGYVLGALWLGRFPRLRRRGLWAYIATLLSGLLVAAFGLLLPIPVLAVAALVIGLSMSVFSLIWTNTLQELVPRHLLGRVSSLDALGSLVLTPIGFGLIGWATDLFGAPVVFIIGGSLTVGLALLGLAHPAIRNLD